MGWTIPWYSTTDDFSADFDVPESFGLNVFLRDGDRIFRTYFTTGRGVEALGSVWTFLDLTPLGRQEDWEDSPRAIRRRRRTRGGGGTTSTSPVNLGQAVDGD